MAKPEPTLPPVEPVVVPMRVSVIVIARNQVGDVRLTLAALEKSVPREMLEILVVDAGSDDATRDLESEYPAIRLLRTPRNFGWTKSANIGTRTAKGEFLFFLPPGALVQPGTVPQLVARLDAESDVTVVCPFEIDAAGQPVGTCFALPDAADLGTRVSTGQWAMAPGTDFPAGAPILIRRQSIVQINYLDEKRYGQFGADLDLFYQMKRGGRRVVVAADIPVTVTHRAPELATGTNPVDLAHGAATYTGKWYGFGAGLGMRLKFALARLGSLDFGGFVGVLSGDKLDGK